MLFLLLLAVFHIVGPVQSEKWDYGLKGPSEWVNLGFGKCGGQRQSPINIEPANAVEDVGMLSLGNDLSNLLKNMRPSKEILRNTAHGLQVDITGGYIMDVWQNLVERTQYQLDQFHFHWANTPSSGGSEHTIDARQHFGELHLVHHNTIYSDLSTAVPQSDGLAVLGFFVEVQGDDNPAFQRLLDFTSPVELSLASTPITGLTDGLLFDLLQPAISTAYFRYPGSLTTPTCDESVLWTVFEGTIKISAAQALRLTTAIQDSSNVAINSNFRPVQGLNGRTVLKSQDPNNPLSPVFTYTLTYIRALVSLLKQVF